jgi:6-phosphogluconolactonase
MSSPQITHFGNRQSAALYAAQLCRQVLRKTGRVTPPGKQRPFVVSGGQSVAPVLKHLAHEAKQMDGMIIIPADERAVSIESPQRNESQIKTALPMATLWPLADASGTRWSPTLTDSDTLAWDHAVSLLSMGEDGHIASLFPNLPAVGNAQGQLEITHAPKAPPHRYSWDGAKLGAVAHTVLLVFGRDRCALFDDHKSKQASADVWPVAHLISGRTALSVVQGA